MSKVVRLGVDIGTTSIAVNACIEEGDTKVIMPPVVKHVRWNKVSAKENEKSLSAFERGDSMLGKTPASVRRLNRSMRKNVRRRRARMDRLAKALRIRLAYDNSYSTGLVDAKIKAMHERVDTNTLCHILMDYCRYRGYNQLSDDEIESDTEYKSRMNDISLWCQSNQKTISQFLLDHGLKAHRKDDDERSAGGIPIDQSLYRQELADIWNKQREYDERLTDELFDELIDIIYHRRPLRSQKYLKSKCELEPNKRVCARSDPWFESFRTWAMLRNLRATYEGKDIELPERYLREDLYAASTKGEVTRAAMLSLLAKHHPDKVKKHFDINYDSIPAMNTYASIGKTVNVKEMSEIHDIWHCIHAEPSQERRMNALVKHGYTKEESEKLSRIRLAQGTSSYSQKAVMKMLPYMNGALEGMDEHHARETMYPQKAQHAKKELTTIANGKLRNPLVQSIVNEAIRTIKPYIASIGVQPTDIVVEMTRSLSRNPKQRKADHKRNKQRNKVNNNANDVLSSLGIPITTNNRRRYLLWMEQGGSCELVGDKAIPSSSAVCIYSGDPISLSQAFNPMVTENEHTIPRSRLFMNGMNNLTLASFRENKKKGNLTAAEYIATKSPSEQEAILERIDKFYGHKEHKFKYELFQKKGSELSGLLGDNHLTMTGYIATQLKSKLTESFDGVIASNGTVTSLIRGNLKVKDRFIEMALKDRRIKEEKYGVKTIKNDDAKDPQNGDKRFDLRHHGMDAIICSLVRPEYIQRLSSANADPANKMEGAMAYINKELSKYVDDIDEAMAGTIVIRPRERDPFFHRTQNGGKSYGVRGPLHEQNPQSKYYLVDTASEKGKKKMASLMKREKELTSAGRDLHKEYAPLFKSKYIEGISQEHHMNGGSLKEVFADPRLKNMGVFHMIDPNLTEDSYLRRNGHFLSNSTNHRVFVGKNGKSTVEPLHQYISKKRKGEVLAEDDHQFVIYVKSLILLGYDRTSLNEVIEQRDRSFLNDLYWVSSIEVDGRLKLFPHNMTSSEMNKPFELRQSAQSLLKKYGKILVLDQRELISSWMGSFLKEATEA